LCAVVAAGNKCIGLRPTYILNIAIGDSQPAEPVFEKTCATTQKTQKVMFFGFWKKYVKKRKNVDLRIVSQAT